ncbi:MAG: hypothetical protein GY851_16280 [bacterium]|nr:hypothetical protein [bacterium]
MVSLRTLNILAAVVWYIGGVVLLTKAGSLLLEARALQPDGAGLWIAPALGLVAGALKARFLFSKACVKNLARIASLENPKLWQFYRPGFFLFLAAMIILGATLSRLAHGNYGFLLGVGALDLSLSVALLGSSVVFWRQRAFRR